MAVSFHLSEEAAAMATHSSVMAEAASLLDGGFYRRRWQLLLLAWVVKFPLSEVVAPVTSWLLLLLSGGLIRRQRQLLLLDVAGRVATSSVDGGSCIVADGSMAVGSEAVFILFSHISSESSGSS